VWYVKSLQILSRTKYKIFIAVCLNILGQICRNIDHPWNYTDLATLNAYFNEFSLDTQRNNNDRLHTWLVKTKFNMGTLDLDILITIISLFGSWSIARFNMSDSWLIWAQQSISSLASFSAGQTVTVCNDTTLYNPQDLDLDGFLLKFCLHLLKEPCLSREITSQNVAAAFAKNI